MRKAGITSLSPFQAGMVDLSRDNLNLPERKEQKSENKNQITVVTSWRYAKEVSPTFKRLMMLLLRDTRGNKK